MIEELRTVCSKIDGIFEFGLSLAAHSAPHRLSSVMTLEIHRERSSQIEQAKQENDEKCSPGHVMRRSLHLHDN
jgi:hypothetical protein